MQKLPSDIEVEQAVIGSCLIDENGFERIEGRVVPSDFYDFRNQTIFEAIEYLHKEEIKIDLLTLSSRLKSMRSLTKVGGNEYLASLANKVPTSANIVHYSNIVAKLSIRRKLISTAAQITELAYNEKKKVDEILEQADKDIVSIIEGNSEKLGDEKPSELKDLAMEFDEFYNSNESDGIQLGIPELDEVLLGLPSQEVMFVYAPTGGKKSMFVQNVAYNIAKQGKKVLYVNLEMNNRDIIGRLISIASGLDSYKIKRREFNNGEIDYALGRLSEVNLKIASPATISIPQLERMAKLEQKKNGLDILIVDHLHIIKSRVTDPVVRTGEIAEGLKTIAKKLDIPVIAPVQINRFAQMNGKKPEKTDARDSSVIENTARCILSLQPTDTPEIPLRQDENQVNIWITKNRNGYEGQKIPIPFNWRSLRFGRKEEEIETVNIEDLPNLL